MADKTCGLFAVLGVQAALLRRAWTGEGRYVEFPMPEWLTGFIFVEHLHGQTFVPARGKIGHPTALTPYRYPTKTLDGYIVIMLSSRRVAQRFLERGGFHDPYNSALYLEAHEGKEFHEILAEAAPTRPTAEWMAICAETSVPAMRANRLGEGSDDPHLKAAGVFEDRDRPDALARYKTMRPSTRFSKCMASITRDPPRLGHDTETVLASLETLRLPGR